MKFQPYILYSSTVYEGYIYTTSVTDYAVSYVPISSTSSVLSMPPHQFAISSSLAFDLTPVSTQTLIPDLQDRLTLDNLHTYFPELLL